MIAIRPWLEVESVRLLLVANTLPPHDLSGVGEQVVQLATGLRERGHEVRVLGRQTGGARGPKMLFPLSVGGALERSVKAFRPDVVQVHESDAGLALRNLRRRRGIAHRPLLIALQQVSYVEERRAVRALVWNGEVLGRPGGVERRFRAIKAPLQILLGRWTARAADLVLAPSLATARELERDYGVHGVEVLPNVTGGGEVAPADLGPGMPTSEDLLVFVGRLRIRKGVEVLFAALRELAAGGARPHLVVAGEGEHRRALQRAARAFGVEQQVHFFGRADAGQVRALLARGRPSWCLRRTKACRSWFSRR